LSEGSFLGKGGNPGFPTFGVKKPVKGPPDPDRYVPVSGVTGGKTPGFTPRFKPFFKNPF
jgi:hypothetical protein